jgi:nitrate reductase assembly molybdenum cofactor insertion protein NarJ
MKDQAIAIPDALLLASTLCAYPNQGWLNSLRALAASPNAQLPDVLRTGIDQLDETRIDALRSEYLRLFDLPSDRISLHESEYGRTRSLFKTNTLADIAGFYRAFGFELGSGQEMLDHISVELEFYALLQMKWLYLDQSGDPEGSAIVTDAMRSFLQDHLGCFVPAICSRLEHLNSDWYQAVFSWTDQLLQDQCASLGAIPETAIWQQGQPEPDTMSCQVQVPFGGK